MVISLSHSLPISLSLLLINNYHLSTYYFSIIIEEFWRDKKSARSRECTQSCVFIQHLFDQGKYFTIQSSILCIVRQVSWRLTLLQLLISQWLIGRELQSGIFRASARAHCISLHNVCVSVRRVIKRYLDTYWVLVKINFVNYT